LTVVKVIVRQSLTAASATKTTAIHGRAEHRIRAVVIG